jgi:hypothetical protein
MALTPLTCTHSVIAALHGQLPRYRRVQGDPLHLPFPPAPL